MLAAAMPTRPAFFDRAIDYVRRHPDELGRVLKDLGRLRVGVPVAALRYVFERLAERGGPENLTFEPVPPGFRVGADVDLMQTPVRAETTVYVEDVAIGEDTFRVELRLEDTRMEVRSDGKTPVAALIRSGALDLTKAGSLAAHLPGLDALLAESHDNRLVIDLQRHPALADPLVRRLVAVVTSMLTIRSVETEHDRLSVGFRAFPRGLRGAARAVREHVVRPARPWIRGMLGAGRR